MTGPRPGPGQPIRLRQGRLRFEVRQAGAGAPLVYLPSVLDGPAADGWPPLAASLARTRAVSVPHLVADAPGVEPLDDLLDLVLAHDELLEALGPGPVDLVGHADGGMLAAEVAAVCPARVRSLVLIAPLGLWRDDAPTADTLILPPADLAAVLWADPGGDAARLWSALPEEEAANVAAQIDEIQRRAGVARFLWPLPDKGLRKRLHRVRAPTLLVWGDADRANPPVYVETWRAALPAARVVVLPGGHMLTWETPRGLADVIADWLRPPSP